MSKSIKYFSWFIITKLLKHQKQKLYFMINRIENSTFFCSVDHWMFDSFEKSKNSSEMKSNSFIITKLSKHQKQKLYYTMNKIENSTFSWSHFADHWMFDSFEKSKNLFKLKSNFLITTKLLKHQKQKLHFMMNRKKKNLTNDQKKQNNWLQRGKQHQFNNQAFRKIFNFFLI